jgi:hypothetical protein
LACTSGTDPSLGLAPGKVRFPTGENAFASSLRCLPRAGCGRKKGLPTVKSPGCAAFGHPGKRSGFALRQISGGSLSGGSKPRVPHTAAPRSAIKADVLVEHGRYRSERVPRGRSPGRCGGRSGDGLRLARRFELPDSRRRRETTVAPLRVAATATGRRSCHDTFCCEGAACDRSSQAWPLPA